MMLLVSVLTMLASHTLLLSRCLSSRFSLFVELAGTRVELIIYLPAPSRTRRWDSPPRTALCQIRPRDAIVVAGRTCFPERPRHRLACDIDVISPRQHTCLTQLRAACSFTSLHLPCVSPCPASPASASPYPCLMPSSTPVFTRAYVVHACICYTCTTHEEAGTVAPPICFSGETNTFHLAFCGIECLCTRLDLHCFDGRYSASSMSTENSKAGDKPH